MRTILTSVIRGSPSNSNHPICLSPSVILEGHLLPMSFTALLGIVQRLQSLPVDRSISLDDTSFSLQATNDPNTVHFNLATGNEAGRGSGAIKEVQGLSGDSKKPYIVTLR